MTGPVLRKVRFNSELPRLVLPCSPPYDPELAARITEHGQEILTRLLLRRSQSNFDNDEENDGGSD